MFRIVCQGDKVCFDVETVCSDTKNDEHIKTSVECSSHDVLENELNQENIASKICHMKLEQMKTLRQKDKVIEDLNEDKTCTGNLPYLCEPMTSSVDDTTGIDDVVNNNPIKPEPNHLMSLIQLVNSTIDKFVCDNKEHEGTNVTGNLDVNASTQTEIGASERTNIALNMGNSTGTQRERKKFEKTRIACSMGNLAEAHEEKRELLGMERRKITKCASTVCNKENTLRDFPKRFFKLPSEQQQRLRLYFGLEDDGEKLCIKCYQKLYNKTWTLQKGMKKMKNHWMLKVKHSNCCKRDYSKEKKRVGNNTKMYACGWCKFCSDKAETVMEHHHKEHLNREMDVVRLKSPRARLPSGIGFKCDSCNYSGRLRHELHLHNDQFHRNTLNRDGITDYESESSYSPVYPYYFYKMTLPSNYFHLQQKYKLKDVKVTCKDFLKSGLDDVMEIANREGISKFCVDSLTEDEFVSVATKYRKNVRYCDARVDNYVPVDISEMDLKDIETIVRY